MAERPRQPESCDGHEDHERPLAGTMLDQVASVPVVVKILDSAEKLSVQNHPVTPDVHKDEMWYILHADPGAYLFCVSMMV